jgi:hypothetical protein
MTNIQIANSELNATAYVDLNCTNFTMGLKRLNRTQPVIGQQPSLTSDTDIDISDGDQLGIENPKIVIKGVIDVESFATDDDLHATTGITEITLGYLKELWRVKASSTTTIQIFFGSDNAKEFRAYDGGGVVGIGKRDITVLVDSIDINPSQDSEGAHLINYSMNLTEIKSS